jgi:hypothetical protein
LCDDPLSEGDIFSRSFSSHILRTRRIEDIILVLKCTTEDDPDLSPSIEFIIRYSSKYPSCEETHDDKYPRLLIMETDELIEREIGLERETVTDLSTHDSEISERTSHLTNQSDIPSQSETLKTKCLECITYEESHRFIVFFPDGEFSSAILIIVQTWEIIMYERITVDIFEPHVYMIE